LIVPRDDDHGKIFAKATDRFEQTHCVRPMLKIDHREIQIAARSADNPEGLPRVTGKMANALGRKERVRDNILQRCIARQQDYYWRFHKPSFRTSAR